ncbi:hypothetical protein Tco_0553081, partial [Tanacetum coccineum]
EPRKEGDDSSKEDKSNDQEKDDNVNSTNTVNVVSSNKVNVVGAKTSIELPDDPNMPELEDIVYSNDDEDVGAEADINNLDTFIPVSPIPTTRVHKDHPVEQIIEDLNLAPQTRRITKNLKEHGLFSSVLQRTSHKDFQNCLFACFLSQEEPKKMDANSAFLYGKIEYEVYVFQPPGFEDPDFPNKCKKQTVVANSTTEAEYVAASSCCGQVLWIQNQLLDYGDSNEKKLIQMIKIHTGKNVVDLLTKAFDNGMEKLLRMELESGLIVDFLNANPIRYALTINPTIYAFCIKQFWATVKMKTVNGEVQLQALVDGKKIIITEGTVRRDLQFEDAEGFSGRDTPLFPTMMVQAQEEIGEGSDMPTDPQYTPIITQPSSSQSQRKQKSRRPKRKDIEIPRSSVPSDPTNVADEAVNEEPSIQLKELMDFCTKLQQRVLDLENTKTAQAQEITSLKLRVKRLEKKGGSRTHKLKRLYKVGRSARIVSSDEDSLGDQEDASKQERKIDDIDKDAEITLVDETQGRHGDDLMFDTVLTAGEVVTTANVVVSTASTIPVSVVTITEDEITLAQALAELKSVKPKVTTATTVTTKVILLQEPSESRTTTTTIPSKDKGKGIMVKEPLKMKMKYQISFDEQSIKATSNFMKKIRPCKEKAPTTMKRGNTFIDMDTVLVEGSEVRAEEVIPDEEEVAVDAIPLATKPPSIVDYKIIKEGKISNYQIIRADGSSKRYSAFIQMLKSFDREDLETLWKLVKAKHEDLVWRNLHGNKVLVWKLFDSYGVYFVRFQSLHVFMLVEKRFPLTPATIIEMLNKKLQADRWNEMCYQLLKLITKKLKNQ